MKIGPVTSENVTINAADGFRLAASIYPPGSADRRDAVVLINSGTGILRQFYGRYAAYLSSHGLPAITWDYRGIGESRPASLRGFAARMRDWGEKDLEGVLAYLEGEFPSRAILVVGHSAGGQILGLSARASHIAAVVAVAAQSGFYRHWPRPRRWAMAALWGVVMPGATAALGYFPARALGLGEDLPRGVAFEWATWCRNPQYMVGDDGRPLRPHFDVLRAPILGYSFSDDPFAPRAAVEQMLSFYRHAPRIHRHLVPHESGLPKIGHFGFFRENVRDTLWAESLDFLLRRGAIAA